AKAEGQHLEVRELVTGTKGAGPFARAVYLVAVLSRPPDEAARLPADPRPHGLARVDRVVCQILGRPGLLQLRLGFVRLVIDVGFVDPLLRIVPLELPNIYDDHVHIKIVVDLHSHTDVEGDAPSLFTGDDGDLRIEVLYDGTAVLILHDFETLALCRHLG